MDKLREPLLNQPAKTESVEENEFNSKSKNKSEDFKEDPMFGCLAGILQAAFSALQMICLKSIFENHPRIQPMQMIILR